MLYYNKFTKHQSKIKNNIGILLKEVKCDLFRKRGIREIWNKI